MAYGGQVITTQPSFQQRMGPRDWHAGLFDCCDDMKTCCIVTWCHPFYLCYLYGKMNENCATPLCHPAPLLAARGYYRGKFNIEGSLCDDCLVGIFCAPCAMCQMKQDMHQTGHFN